MTTQQAPHLDVIRVTDETTKAEIEEALGYLRAAQKRAPEVMVERYHAKYDFLLDEWRVAPA